ncbi:hypothetical protein [Micromonospora mirobrigensis]|uniref:Oligosaccharide repeat unit polymerase n=1 Tax=Micromonospora mirobrigensis TaxID=262898 RepID=A0A1C4Z951_9ACTN|nr:hypothetical protein [Micromonospora mirobrigensis]SCF29470.1 hypothetical protein GA0070564_105198 [Micromonospora mirobrigensis]
MTAPTAPPLVPVRTALPGQAPPPPRRRSASDGIIATALVAVLGLVLVLWVPNLRHWLMVPLTLSGMLIGVDVVRWFRPGTDVFEPRACAGLLGFQFLYVAPVLHISLNTWSADIYDAPYWPDAIGAFAVLNVVGLSIYRLVLAVPRRARGRRQGPGRRLNPGAFYLIGTVAALFSLATFGYEVVMFGGVSGFVAAMTDRVHQPDLTGMGSFIIVAEAFPTIIFALALVRWRRALSRSAALTILLMLALTLTQFFVGGLKGSRSTTLWPILLCLIMIHLTVRRIGRRPLAVVALIVFAFMYVYGFYKSGGVDAVKEFGATGRASSVESQTGRDLPLLLTEDLGRADIQSVILYRQLHSDFEPVSGVTYLSAVLRYIPRSIRPTGVETKVDVGSRVLYNPLYTAGEGPSSKVYGMAGEGMLNFGLVGGLLAFAAFGLVVRFVGDYYESARQGVDLVPKLLAPMAWALVNANGADLDNLLDFLLKYAAPLALVVLLAREAPDRTARDGRLGPGLPMAGVGSRPSRGAGGPWTG